MIWCYQNGMIVQVIEEGDWDAGRLADLFSDAIYFYAELCPW